MDSKLILFGLCPIPVMPGADLLRLPRPTSMIHSKTQDSLPNSVFNDTLLGLCSQPWWEYLHHGNWQMLQIKPSPLLPLLCWKSLLLRNYQTPAATTSTPTPLDSFGTSYYFVSVCTSKILQFL